MGTYNSDGGYSSDIEMYLESGARRIQLRAVLGNIATIFKDDVPSDLDLAEVFSLVIVIDGEVDRRDGVYIKEINSYGDESVVDLALIKV
jgi:hypothetical protein